MMASQLLPRLGANAKQPQDHKSNSNPSTAHSLSTHSTSPVMAVYTSTNESMIDQLSVELVSKKVDMSLDNMVYTLHEETTV